MPRAFELAAAQPWLMQPEALDTLLAGAFAHRGQPGAGRQQLVADAGGETAGELFGESERRGAGEHGQNGDPVGCACDTTDTDLAPVGLSVAVLWWSATLE